MIKKHKSISEALDQGKKNSTLSQIHFVPWTQGEKYTIILL